MNSRVALLAVGVWAAGLMLMAGGGCAPSEQRTANYQSPETAARLLAIQAGGPSTKDAAKALNQLLKSANPIYRAEAAQTLGTWAAIGNPQIIAPAITHRDPLVRSIAQAAYMEHSPDGFGALMVRGCVMDVHPTVLKALAQQEDPQGLVEPAKVILPLQDKLRQSLDSDPENAVLAADVLARVGDAGARRILIHLIESSDGEVLAKAAMACPRDDTELGTTLLPLAFGDGLLARRAVMMALVLKPNPWLKDIPLKGLHDRDPVIRRNAIRAIGNLDGAAPVEELAAMLDGTGTDKADIIQALGSMGQRGAEVLRRYVHNGSPPVGLEVTALVALAPHATRDDIPWVSEKLTSKNKHVRTAALNILGQIGNPSAQAAVMTMVKDPEDEVRAAAAKALGQLTTVYASMELTRMLKDSSPKVRSMAARGLGKANYSKAVPALKKLALVPAATSEPPDRLDNVYGRPELAAVEALGRIATPKAVAVLCDLTESKSWLTRAMAAHALGATGNHTPAVAKALEKLLQDPVNLVRAEAGISLSTLGTPVTE